MPESRDSSAAARPGAVRFGPFTLEPAARRLWQGQERIPLPSRAIDALAYLITHRDRVVEKDEIIAAVWHDVAVTDDSLIHAVSVVRRALGDDPAHAAFVETVPRRGYRFVGEVEFLDQPVGAHRTDALEAAMPHPAPYAAVASNRWWRRTAARLALAAVVLAASAGAALYLARSADTRRDAAVSLQQAAPSGTTIVSGGVVSPTGRHLALVAQDERTGQTALWIRAVDAAEPRLVPGTTGASKPFFSPDGRRVAFFADGRLGAADLTGDNVRTIAPVRGAPAGGTWGTDGVIVFAEWTTGLSAVSVNGGPTSTLTRLDHAALDVAHAWPQFLPGGRRVLFQIVSPDAARAGVYVASLDSRESIRLLDEASAATYVEPGFLLYLQRDLLMAQPFDAGRLRLGGRAVLLARGVTPSSLAEGAAISASREALAFRAGAAERQLTWVDRTGEPQGALKVPTSMFNFRISPDGRSVLAASSLTDATGVWLVDLARRHSTQVAVDGMAAIWSPDGHRVAFTSRAGLDLHVRRSVGDDGLEPLVSDPSVKVLNDWSPSAQTIIYTRHGSATLLDLWHVSAAGGAGRPLLITPFNEAQARLSFDGRWIAYMSDSSGRSEVYVRRYPELDAPRQVSIGGGSQPQWRADQQELFYLAPDRSLMAVTVRPAANESFGAPRRLFRAPIADSPSDARDSYAAMPDGRSFLIDGRRDGVSAPITLMRHWAAGLTAPPTALAARYEANRPERR
jgi:DNA-binding winged helix-turn-helix (wHTH) protein/Tol biopolymer transport system component